MEFGSKAKKKVPIASTLDSTMEFIQMGLKNKDDDDEQMSTSPQSSPNSKNEDISDHSLFMASAESVHGPFPKNISQQDGNTMLEFLKEWREEVENEAQSNSYYSISILFVIALFRKNLSSRHFQTL